MTLPGQIWQELDQLSHFVRALRIWHNFYNMYLIGLKLDYMHRVPLKFSFPEIIHFMCFIAI